PLDVGEVVVLGVEDGAGAGPRVEPHVGRDRFDADRAPQGHPVADEQVAGELRDEDRIAGDGVQLALRRGGGVDVERVGRVAGSALERLEVDVAAGDVARVVAGGRVEGRAVGGVHDVAVLGGQEDVERGGADQAGAEVAGHLGQRDVAVGEDVDVAG